MRDKEKEWHFCNVIKDGEDKKTKYVDFLRDRDRGDVIKIYIGAATTEQLANRAR